MSMKKNTTTTYIAGERIVLRPLVLSDVGPTYLGWMNDPQIQKFTRRRGTKTTLQELRSFVRASKNSGDVHLAIITTEGQHIGNIFLNAVNLKNKSADLSIMIGDPRAQGKGYAQEAISLLTAYAFKKLKLHRMSAGSPNPRFTKVVEKLGWKKEGVEREAFKLGSTYSDIERWSILHDEYEH